MICLSTLQAYPAAANLDIFQQQALLFHRNGTTTVLTLIASKHTVAQHKLVARTCSKFCPAEQSPCANASLPSTQTFPSIRHETALLQNDHLPINRCTKKGAAGFSFPSFAGSTTCQLSLMPGHRSTSEDCFDQNIQVNTGHLQ
jgi:hypothetical protein